MHGIGTGVQNSHNCPNARFPNRIPESGSQRDHEFPKECSSLGSKSERGLACGTQELEVGTRWTKYEFVDMAKKVTHPFDQHPKVPQRSAKAWAVMAAMGPEKVIEFRKHISLLKVYYKELTTSFNSFKF